MKTTVKTRAILLFLILNLAFLLLFSSCGKKLPSELLDYQKSPFKLTGTLEYGDKEYDLVFETEGTKSTGEIKSAKISFKSPEALKGGVLNIDTDGVTFTVEGVRIPITEGTLSGVAKLPDFFSLSATDIVERKEETHNGMAVTKLKFQNDSGDVTIYINKETGYPVRVEMTLPKVNEVSDGRAVLSITKFEPTTQEET